MYLMLLYLLVTHRYLPAPPHAPIWTRPCWVTDSTGSHWISRSSLHSGTCRFQLFLPPRLQHTTGGRSWQTWCWWRSYHHPEEGQHHERCSSCSLVPAHPRGPPWCYWPQLPLHPIPIHWHTAWWSSWPPLLPSRYWPSGTRWTEPLQRSPTRHLSRCSRKWSGGTPLALVLRSCSCRYAWGKTLGRSTSQTSPANAPYCWRTLPVVLSSDRYWGYKKGHRDYHACDTRSRSAFHQLRHCA